jgi:hypothetical protein
VFTAEDILWKDEPGVQRHIPKQARGLGWQIEYPHARWGGEMAAGYVWHCSLSIKGGHLADEQWSGAAHDMVRALGFDGADGKAPCRWIAVRHGTSANGNDHIHIAVNLIREDGTKASTWNDRRKAGRICTDLEDRFGLPRVQGRLTGRTLPEPSRADRELSAKAGTPEPLRISLERKVRACAAVATSEDHFTQLAKQRGLLVRPRYAADTMTVVGYAFADGTARRTTAGTPIWFGGGKLAPDLTVTKLRERWQTTTHSPFQNAADHLAAAATATEHGALAQAERHMARAAQEPCLALAVVATMADTFTAVTGATSRNATVTLVREAAALVDACLSKASTATARIEIQNASTLIHASAQTLARQADQQAMQTLRTEAAMSELTHEDELLDHLARAGVLSAQLFRAFMNPAGTGQNIAALRAAGYTETTPYDADLRQALGEQRWAKYVTDPARIAAAAAITDAGRAGYDVPALLEAVVNQRRWEDDSRNPAHTVARVLHYRVNKYMTAHPPRRTPADSPATATSDYPKRAAPLSREHGIPRQPAPPREPKPVPPTPYDDKLRDLLQEHRWAEYASDDRRADVAEMINTAAAEGRDMNALLTHAVTRREWEDDPKDPSRRVAGVLHFRIKAALAGNDFPPQRDLPEQAADTLAQSTAPAGSATHTRTQNVNTQKPPRTAERPPDGRDGR